MNWYFSNESPTYTAVPTHSCYVDFIEWWVASTKKTSCKGLGSFVYDTWPICRLCRWSVIKRKKDE